MLRELLTLVVPLVLPTLVYLLWLRALRWSGADGVVVWQSCPGYGSW